MKIVDIFAIVEGSLFAVQFEGEEFNEFEKLRRNWQNPEFVNTLFKKITYSNYYKFSVDELKIQILERSAFFFNKLLSAAKGEESIQLDAIFRPLNNNEYTLADYQESKYKKFIFRIYAVRLGENCYVISGGGIKLVKTMQENEYLSQELSKIKFLKNYLIERDLYE